MTPGNLLASFRASHQDCCIVRNCTDNRCSISLGSICKGSLLVIHGERYRKAHGNQSEKMADRILIASEPTLWAAVIELKGGNSMRRRDIKDAVEQVQKGIAVIEDLLSPRYLANVTIRTFLAYSGRLNRQDNEFLANNRIIFRGSPTTLRRVDCGSSLDSILSLQG